MASSIPPYRIAGPVRLQLLDSPGHLPPLQPVAESMVEAETLHEAFVKSVNRMPWNNFHVSLPDGFQYPSGKIRLPGNDA